MNKAKHYIDELYAISEYDKEDGLYDSKVATLEEKVTTSYPDGGSSKANGACSDAKGVCSYAKVTTSDRKVTTSDGKVTTFNPNGGSSGLNGGSIWDSFPKDLRDRIISFGKRVPQRVLFDTIVDLCKIKPLSGEELATLLGKTEPHIKNKILPERLAAHRIQFTIPEMKNHPNQKYTSE